MCHAKIRGGHSARFRAELARIASMGHIGAARELALLDPNRITIGGILLALAKHDPHRSWRTIRGEVATRFGLSVGELRRLAPWARAEWYWLKREVQLKATHPE
jgi:hypothetical protein